MINDYRNAIRDHINQMKKSGSIGRLIVWDVQTDEVTDPTLLSLRAYGSRDHADAVMVAAGSSGIWEKLEQTRIALPTLVDLIQLARDYK